MSESDGRSDHGQVDHGPGDHGQLDHGQSKRFDPRFSPAFQPGYDPRVHREAPPSAPLREEPRRDWPETRRNVSGAAADGTGPDEISIFSIPERVDDVSAPTVLEDVEPVPWWRRINPWFIVLWVLGLAIILLALQLANVVFDTAFLQGTNNADLGYLMSMFLQMVIFGLPSLICLGLATFVTPFVILAARWRRP